MSENFEGGKSILLSNFTFVDNTKSFINFIEKKFDISKCDVFIYNLNRSNKFAVTFKLEMKKDEKIDFKKILPNSIPIHKKGEAYYTLNALNKLIEESSDVDPGNIDYKSFSIDWGKYQNKMILLEDDELVMHDILRVF